jgi:glycosyltransferase involved in cell wall biosynthesis
VTRPLVCIVTPSYNQAAFLEETIRSVLDQDYEPIEYLIVDDGSTDESVEIIKRYGDRISWWTQQENSGQASALNRGFARSTGAFLAFLNSDDALLPDAVSTMVDAFGRDESLLLVFGDALTVQDGQVIGTLRAGEWDPARMVARGENPVPQQSSMWRRTAWDLAGPFDEESFFYFEYEFLVRLSRFGRGHRIGRPLARFRLHEASKTPGYDLEKADDFIRVADLFLTGPEVPSELRGRVRRGRASLYLRAASVFYQAGEVRRSRRAFARALSLDPRAYSTSYALQSGKSLVPEAIVRRRRAARAPVQ